MTRPSLDFPSINAAALAHCPRILFDWLPEGRLNGVEFVARNPRREDRSIGSFSINTKTGRWCDFASGDKGGDLVSLLAYLRGIGQGDAARLLASDFGVDHG